MGDDDLEAKMEYNRKASTASLGPICVSWIISSVDNGLVVFHFHTLIK